MVDRDNDEKLLRRLHRVLAAAHAMTGREDRRRLLVLESELGAVRAELNARSGRLAEKMNAAGARLNAISAYARGASLNSRAVRRTPTT